MPPGDPDGQAPLRSTAAGNVEATSAPGVRYAMGEGVAQDCGAARGGFEKAAAGDADAEARLAEFRKRRR